MKRNNINNIINTLSTIDDKYAIHLLSKLYYEAGDNTKAL